MAKLAGAFPRNLALIQEMTRALILLKGNEGRGEVEEIWGIGVGLLSSIRANKFWCKTFPLVRLEVWLRGGFRG